MMSPPDDATSFNHLWQAMARALESPCSESEIGAIGFDARLPSPWLTWTLIGLVRHRWRQHWVAEIVRSRLGADLQMLAQFGTMGHPLKSDGEIPGLPEWTFYFHGGGCCFTHKRDGQRIDVDFYPDGQDGFDWFFYEDFLRSSRKSESPELRLIALHPSIRTASLSFDSLFTLGILAGASNRPPFLSQFVLDYEDLIESFSEAWDQPSKRHRLAVSIGDWLAAQASLPGHTSNAWREQVAHRAQVACVDRRATLRSIVEPDYQRQLAEIAMSELESQCPKG